MQCAVVVVIWVKLLCVARIFPLPNLVVQWLPLDLPIVQALEVLKMGWGRGREGGAARCRRAREVAFTARRERARELGFRVSFKRRQPAGAAAISRDFASIW